MKTLSFSLAFAAAGCATAPAPTGGTDATYRALGTEPFWSVTIGGGRMTYDSANGPRFSVPVPASRPTLNGYRYEAPRLTVDVTHTRCSDGMSDRIYADTVLVIVDGEGLRGCGGTIHSSGAT